MAFTIIRAIYYFRKYHHIPIGSEINANMPAWFFARSAAAARRPEFAIAETAIF
jgi:hypothetical protein